MSAGLLGETEMAQAILEGTFVPPEGTDKHTCTMPSLLKRLSEAIKAGKIDDTVTGGDFLDHWKKAEEDTSSSISSIHFGHYKSAKESALLTEIHALFSHITTKTGHPLPRWSVGLKFILLKELGNLKINKLRAIFLAY